MPTPAKLVASVLFAALCWWVGETIVRHALPEESSVGWFREILAFGGLIVGWRYIGRITTGERGRGTTMTRAITAGVGAAFIMMILTLALHSFYEMILESLGSRYTEVGQAAQAWMEFTVKDAQILMVPIVPITLFAGGAIVGLLAGIMGRSIR